MAHQVNNLDELQEKLVRVEGWLNNYLQQEDLEGDKIPVPLDIAKSIITDVSHELYEISHEGDE